MTLALMVYATIFLLFYWQHRGLARFSTCLMALILFRIAALDIPFYGVYFMFIHALTGSASFPQQAIAASIYSLTKCSGSSRS